MLTAALAFVLPPLLRARGDAFAAKRRAIEQALRAGVIGEHEAAKKLAKLEAASSKAASSGADGASSAQTSSPLGVASWSARPSRAVPAALALLIPLLAIGLYRLVGEPRALDPVWRDALAATAPQAQAAGDGQPAPDMEQAVAGLAERMKDEPDDLEGWMLLGRAYKTMERFAPAREALANAYRLAPENADVLIEYAEALVLASDSRRFQGEALQMLTQAVELQPDSQRGLWLMGIAAYQAENYAQSVQMWEKLLTTLPADAEPRAALQERIADARQRGGLGEGSTGSPATDMAQAAAATPPIASTRSEAAAPAAASGKSDGVPAQAPRLTVTVDIAPELKSKIGAGDVLFVFARAAQGPRMPLAIQRLPAARLPVTVTLDDSTSMMPAMKLSLIPQVVVGARISKSGQATPSPGDFETLSAPLANTQAEPVALLIDRVVP